MKEKSNWKSFFLMGLCMIFVHGCNQTSQEIRAVTGTNLADTLKNDSGFTGIYKSYHPDGYLYSEVSYMDGKKDGTSRRFYSDGKVHSIIQYKEGKKVGTSKWLYTSGELYRETPYSSGKINGIQKKFYRDGIIQAEIPYSQGSRKVGLKEYNTKGTLSKSYPEIQIRGIDRIDTHGRYTLELTLTNKSKNVKFYYEAVQDSTFIPDGGNYVFTEEGIGMVEFAYKETGGFTQDINMVAIYRTRNGNQKILQKRFRLPSDHLSY